MTLNPLGVAGDWSATSDLTRDCGLLVNWSLGVPWKAWNDSLLMNLKSQDQQPLGVRLPCTLTLGHLRKKGDSTRSVVDVNFVSRVTPCTASAGMLKSAQQKRRNILCLLSLCRERV